MSSWLHQPPRVYAVENGVRFEIGIGNRTSYPRSFKAQFDADGHLVIPPSELMFNWPLVSYLPISGGLKDVELVEYHNSGPRRQCRHSRLVEERHQEQLLVYGNLHEPGPLVDDGLR